MSERWSALWMLICMVLGFWHIWAKGPYVPKQAGTARWLAYRREWKAALVRVASGEHPMRGSIVASVAFGERLILAVPAMLCEDVRMRRRPAAAARPLSVCNWSQRSATRRRIRVAPVDVGTFVVTDRRVLFTGAMKRRDFPIDDVIIVGTNNSVGGIALTSRRHGSIAYFTKIRGLSMEVHVTPGPDDRFAAYDISFPFMTHDLESVLQIMRAPASMATV